MALTSEIAQLHTDSPLPINSDGETNTRHLPASSLRISGGEFVVGFQGPSEEK